ncbi:MAG: CHAD domain-containing protein [Halioglobus sp.]
MAYKIYMDRPLEEERKRITFEQIDKSLEELQDDALDVHARVHQFRKRAKKIRALLRLYRPVDEQWYQRENARFRDLAARYGALRDSDAAIDTLNKVRQHFSEQLDPAAFAGLTDSLSDHRSVRMARDVSDAHLATLQSELKTARLEIVGWTDHAITADTLIAGLEKTYRRGRKAMRKCLETDDPVTWHEWRKRTKYQRYQWKLLRRLWPDVIDCWRDQLHELTDLLGDDHDLVVLHQMLRSKDAPQCDETTLEALEGLMSERSASLRTASRSLGAKLFHDKPVAVTDRLQCWLNA